MMKRMRYVALAAAVTLPLAACDNGGGGFGVSGQTAGGLLGAAGGAAIGQTIGKGQGRVLATLAGGVLGGLLGASIGNVLSPAQQQQQQQIVQQAVATGQPAQWQDPSGAYGTATPVSAYYIQPATNKQCRDVEQFVFIPGQPEYKEIVTVCNEGSARPTYYGGQQQPGYY